jgi:hypothetical protein
MNLALGPLERRIGVLQILALTHEMRRPTGFGQEDYSTSKLVPAIEPVHKSDKKTQKYQLHYFPNVTLIA